MAGHQHKGIYLLTGSNMGDRMHHLCFAIQQFEKKGYTVVRQSAVYETAAWGLTAQPAFLNQCLEVEKANLTPQVLMQDVATIEKKAHRQRAIKWGPRTLDIDILLYDDQVVAQPNLSIPHPYLAERRFALLPLAELAAEGLHPSHNLSISALLQACPDTLEVIKYADSACFRNHSIEEKA